MRALNVVKPFPKVTEDNADAPEKANVPTDVTELGMAIEVRRVAPEKALPPIEVKELGSVKEVIPVQPRNAPRLICPRWVPKSIVLSLMSF